MKKRTWVAFSILMTSLAITACNVFDPLDNPGSDVQILSAARAAFDQGRFEEAAAFYSQLSSEYAEVAASESAFQIMDQHGASMGAFMSAFGKGGSNIGTSFTRLAGTLAGQGGTPGKTKRLAIFSAFRKIDSIGANTKLRGLIRFVASAALLSELLAENADSSGLFSAKDLVANPTACRALDTTTCPVNPNTDACAIPGGKVFDDAGSEFFLSQQTGNHLSNPAALAELSVTRPNFQMIQAAFQEISYALTNEISAGGSLGGSTEMFTETFLNLYGTLLGVNADCYRQGLLLNGIGVN